MLSARCQVPDLLSTAISGLKAQKTALEITGNNITNAGTEGYTRQEVVFAENDPQFRGGVWVGSGVNVASIRRVYDEFQVAQLRQDTSTYNMHKTMAETSSQIDSLLADPGTGIQPGLERMFGALQSVTDDPSSLPARQVLLSESQGLVDRFSAIDDRLKAQNEIINGQIDTISGQITTIAKALAEINKEVVFASASAGGNEPSALLDKRDSLLKDLAELVEINVSEQDGNIINVTIGNGQSLVAGSDYKRVVVTDGENDPSRKDIYFDNDGRLQNITRFISGGELGGLLDFREEVLDPSINSLGRLALTMTQSINDQHKLGIDYDGKKGENFFEDINRSPLPEQRVLGSRENAPPNDRKMAVNIKDAGQLTNSDYRVEFTGPNNTTFKVYRESDNSEVLKSALSGNIPDTFEIDGFEIEFGEGSFQKGDSFLLTPSRHGAKDMALSIDRPENVAVAQAIVTDSSLGNQGSGKINHGYVYDADTDFFSEEGKLNPPVIIRFNSDNSYDVLDNTDPTNPIPLFPPIMNQPYVAGLTNEVFPGDQGKTAFTSYGGYLPMSPTYQPPFVTPTTPGNGFFPERVDISFKNPQTGLTIEQPTLITPENATAKEIARLLSERDGIEASARTEVQISDFYHDDDTSSFQPLQLVIAGVDLSETLGANQTDYEPDYPEDVPEEIDANFIADRINANYELQNKGYVARSDGETVTIINIYGEDIPIEVMGDSGDPLENGDSVKISNGQSIELKATGELPFRNLTENSGYDFSKDGPYTYEFHVPGQGTFNIELTGNHATSTSMINEFKSQIQSQMSTFVGDIDVSIDAKGNLSFQSKLEVRGMGPNGSNKVTMGGQVKVVTDPNYTLEIAPPGNNLFDGNPVGKAVHTGFQAEITGNVKAGDTFTVDFNTDGVSDSRNGNFLASLQTNDTIGGNTNFSESYSQMVEEVGSITSRAQINKESSEVLLRQVQETVNSISGVNLDEEATKLIQYELAYNASAQVIQTARDLFDTLINSFR